MESVQSNTTVQAHIDANHGQYDAKFFHVERPKFTDCGHTYRPNGQRIL